ncbi:hypothetical protein ACLKA7_002163 [Drosophila subpalustris]
MHRLLFIQMVLWSLVSAIPEEDLTLINQVELLSGNTYNLLIQNKLEFCTYAAKLVVDCKAANDTELERGSSLVTSSLLRRGLSSSYGRDPQNPCYCKDRCGDPCYNKDRCKVLAAARTEMRSLVRQGLLWKPCYCKDFDPCYSKKLLVFATAKLMTWSLLRKTGDLILATGRIAEESLLRKTGDLILATGRIAEESLLLKTGDLILATGRIAEESLLL